MAALPLGTEAPDFSLPSSEGGQWRLAAQRGRWVVVYFYPRDMTSGCTTEACEFNVVYRELQDLGAEVVGVSGDSLQRHKTFKERHGLEFPLLADADYTVAKLYGAFGEKRFMGKTSHGILRTTYLIDPQGRIARVWEKVKAAGHAAEVLASLKTLQNSG
ncbi:MAG: thioredoxin-dependent thiol peroxidase [Thermoanaerobaculaceae bacterium]